MTKLTTSEKELIKELEWCTSCEKSLDTEEGYFIDLHDGAYAYLCCHCLKALHQLIYH